METGYERFWTTIMGVSRILHKIAASVMDEYGLAGPHAFYLIAISRHPEGITAANLADECDKDKADVSRAVTLMEKKGLLVKMTRGYRAKLKLTEAGTIAAIKLQRLGLLAVERASIGTSDGDRESMYETMDTISSNLCSLVEEGLTVG